VLAGAGAYVYLRQSLPATEGEIQVAGLGAAVEVLRDRHGIPHIYASSLEDAHFALGFVHAQDRLWQMEMSRRIGSGRLAEVLGRNALDADRLMRTLGLRRVAEANLRHYDADARRLLDAYAAGVNAFLDGRPVLPPEFWLLGLVGDMRPEPWSALDSIVWTKVMAWDLAGNWRAELLRMRLSRTLALERIQELLPPYPGDAPPEIADLRALYSGIEKKEGQTPVFSLGSDPDFFSLGSDPPGPGCDRRHAARRARGARRAQRPHRLGPHQHRRRRAGPLPREARCAIYPARGADQGERRNRGAPHGTALAPRAGDLGRAARRAGRNPARLCAGAQMDRARCG